MISKFFLAALLVSSLSYTACKKDDDPDTCIFATELQAETDAVTAAAAAYGSNPTTQNCQAFIVAYEAYLQAAEDLIPCANAAGQGVELQAAIDNAEAQLALIQC